MSDAIVVTWLRGVHQQVETDHPDRVRVERAILDHQQWWDATLRATPEGWSDDGCTGYRMALDWVVDHLAAGWRQMPDYAALHVPDYAER